MSKIFNLSYSNNSLILLLDSKGEFSTGQSDGGSQTPAPTFDNSDLDDEIPF